MTSTLNEPVQRTRTVSIALEPITGHIIDFSLIVGTTLVLATDGTGKRVWTSVLPEQRVPVVLWVTGVPGSQYSLSLDLPGTANDFTVKYTLAGTVHKVEFNA